MSANGTRTYSAWVPSIMWPRIQPPPPRHWPDRPSRQYWQRPQAEMHDTSTRSPGLTVVTPAPTWLDGADGLVAEDPAAGDLGRVAFEDVQVGPADGGGVDADDGVGRVLDHRVGDVLPGLACPDRGTRAPSLQSPHGRTGRFRSSPNLTRCLAWRSGSNVTIRGRRCLASTLVSSTRGGAASQS